MSNPKWKTKFNKLNDKEKEQYCWIEDYFMRYVCDDISLQTFISELATIEMVISALKGNNVAYITPTYNLARVFFDKLTQTLPFESNKSELSVRFPNGGSVEFFTGERMDNLRGRKFHLVVVDEASF